LSPGAASVRPHENWRALWIKRKGLERRPDAAAGDIEAVIAPQGPDCEDTFFRALADYDYELEHSGELTICRGLRAKVREPISIRN
jgi:hypothetical protein